MELKQRGVSLMNVFALLHRHASARVLAPELTVALQSFGAVVVFPAYRPRAYAFAKLPRRNLAFDFAAFIMHTAVGVAIIAAKPVNAIPSAVRAYGRGVGRAVNLRVGAGANRGEPAASSV